MKLIEALKSQKKINEKIDRNVRLLEVYATKLSIEKPIFETDESQRNEVQKLLNANLSLVDHYLWLKRCIEYTNVNVKVEIFGKIYTIADLLHLKRVGIEMILKTYKSLNDFNSQQRITTRKNFDRDVTIDYFYDEKEKNDKIKEWRDLYDAIDSKLEIINATTDMIDINHLNSAAESTDTLQSNNTPGFIL